MYAVCETIEDSEGDKYYTAVPAGWTLPNGYVRGTFNTPIFGLHGNDIMYFSDNKKSAVRVLLGKAKTNPNTPPDKSMLQEWRCTIIRSDYPDFKTADDAALALEQFATESDSETPSDLKHTTISSQTDVFRQIMNEQPKKFRKVKSNNRNTITKRTPVAAHQEVDTVYDYPSFTPASSQLINIPNNFNQSTTSQSTESENIVAYSTLAQSSIPQSTVSHQFNTCQSLLDNIIPVEGNVTGMDLDSMSIVSTVQLNDLMQTVQNQQNKIDTLLETQEAIEKKRNEEREVTISLLNNIKKHITSLEAKLESFVVDPCGYDFDEKIMPFQPVQNEEDLKNLEEKCKNLEFVEVVVKKCGVIFGKGNGHGGTIALNLIYKLFEKQFLVQCSWTGGTRSAGCIKIPFKNYTGVINLFFKTVNYCDPSYTYVVAVDFLQSRIKNAKQNLKVQNIRNSAGRPNRKKGEGKGKAKCATKNNVSEASEKNGENEVEEINSDNENTEEV